MFCSNCGFENSNNNNYCSKCGQQINDIAKNKYQIETIGFCTECGQRATHYYCSNCGSKTINVEIRKNAINPSKILDGKSVNVDILSNLKNSNFIEKLMHQLRDKDSLKRYVITSVIALLVTYIISFLGFLIITNVGDLKSVFQEAKAQNSFPVPNFLDLANLFWLLQFKLRLEISADSHFIYKLFFNIHMVILLVVPFLSVFLSNRYLKKESKVTLIDRLLVSAFFSIIFNIIALINVHHYKDSFFGAYMKFSYGASLLLNLLIVFALYFVISIIVDYKTIIKFQKENRNAIVGLLFHSFDLFKNILIYSSFIIIVSFIVIIAVFKLPLKMIFTLLLLLPNFLVDGINFFLCGVFNISSTNFDVSYSSLGLFKLVSRLVGDEPIFLLSIITFLVFAIGTIYFIARTLIKLIEKYDIKMLSLFVLFTSIIAQIISYITNFKLTPSLSGDTGILGDNMNVYIKYGYSNIKSFIFTLIFLAVITAIVYFVHHSYNMDRVKEILLKPTKNMVIIAAVVSILLIAIQGGIIKKYSFNLVQSIIQNDVGNIMDDFDDIFDTFDNIM